MIINEDDILDPEYYDESKALACLLNAGVCFLFNAKINGVMNTVIAVLISDTFAWGCADAESITNTDGEEGSEIIELYKLWKENPVWGEVKWACLKRNKQPIEPVKNKMIEAGYWDETLETLPENKIIL